VNHRKSQICDFGFDPTQSPYHFVVDTNVEHLMLIVERFVWDDEVSPLGQDIKLKAKLDIYRWSRIADYVADDFNRRLRRDGMRAGTWKQRGETLLAPHLGKELTLLVWAIEDADASVIPNMVMNWTGLAPEERWWLYTTINATFGHPDHGKDRGWRKAIKIAFADNPVGEMSPTALLSSGAEDRAARAGPLVDLQRRREESEQPSQQTLFD
jgi:hypothetical protein